jgi:hypothetical protein
MQAFWENFNWPIFIITSWAVAYFVFIKPMMEKISRTLGKPAQVANPLLSPMQRIMARLDGWKTVILGAGGSLFAAVATLVDTLADDPTIGTEIRDLPWSTFLPPKYVALISAGIMFAMTFTHLVGKYSAARTQPRGIDN